MASERDASPTPQDAAREPRELSELMQTLPQELYDRIYDHTFTAMPGMRFVGHKFPDHDDDYCCWLPSYMSVEQFCQINPFPFGIDSRHARTSLVKHGLFTKPDSTVLLHVDHQSREKFAASFFGGQGTFFAFDQWALMEPFFRTVDPGHIHFIHDIRDT